MDNFYQRLGVRALNDSIPESSKTTEKRKREFIAFVANHAPTGEFDSETAFHSACSLYTENELYGIDEEDIGFDLFGFAGESTGDLDNGKRLYTLTIAGICDWVEKELLFYKKEVDDIIDKIKTAISEKTDEYNYQVYPIHLMKTDYGASYWLYIVRFS